MTETTITAAATPGIKGITRSTWRDETHLRGVLLDLMVRHPDANRDELEALYLAKVMRLAELKMLPPLIEEALRYKFDNDLANIQKAPRRSPISKAEIAAEAERIKTIILLDLMMPNGKPLRSCTGRECRAAGGWLIAVADRIGDRGIVGKKLSEAELINIRDGITPPKSKSRPAG